MVTLQKKFSFKGKDDPSVKAIELSFQAPVFDYIATGESGQRLTRKLIEKHTFTTTVDPAADTYSIELSDDDIAGKDAQAMRAFMLYYAQVMRSDNARLDDLAVNIDVTSATPEKIVLSTTELEGLCLVLPHLVDVNNRLFDKAAGALETSADIYLINKTAYVSLLKKLHEVTGSENEFYLLVILLNYLEFVDNVPSLRKKLPDTTMAQLREFLKARGVENFDKVLPALSKSLLTLFDFPLAVPALQFIDIGGTLQVISPGNVALTRNDLAFLYLSLEYNKKAIASSDLEILHYDWKKVPDPIQNNQVAFSFSDDHPIAANHIDGLVDVTLKGVGGEVLWSNDFEPADPALNKLSIVVTLQQPGTLNGPGGEGITDSAKKLRGQVLQMPKKCSLKDCTVIVQAKLTEASEVWQIVGAATTDSGGNFSMPYPYGPYVAAQAIVSLTPDAPATIAVDPQNGANNESIADDFLYLLVTDPECEDEDDADCDCHIPKKAGRLPGQEDLINSDQYTQDIGGSCVNLSTPNRTLREYSYRAIVRTSDPDVSNYTLRKIAFNPSDPLSDFRFELTGENKKIKRSPVDLNNPIRWQDAPDNKDNLSFYQSVTVATGHVLHYKSEFKADGYSLGDLLYSLALAPGQKKQMVIMDSSHTLLGAETQAIAQGEQLAANIVNDRIITDQIGGAIGESLSGSSSASTAGISAGLGVGVSYGGIGASLGVAGGYSNSNSKASQNSSRDISQSFSERLRQSIMQNAESYRQLNASVVTSVQEGQHYSATTDVVANHNHCHSLTMMYFEVLRHFAIYQELTHVEECIFVPLLMTEFSTENIYKWSDVLARHLLPMHSNTYLRPHSFFAGQPQHPLLKAFDANARIKTNYAHVDFPTGSYDQDQISFVKGEIYLRTNLQRPKTKYDRIKSLPVISKTVSREVSDDRSNAKSAMLALMTGGLSFLLGSDGTYTETEEVLTRGKIFDAFMQLDANYETVPPAQCIRVVNFQTFSIKIGNTTFPISPVDFFQNGIVDKKLWDTYATILGYFNTIDMLDYYFKGRLIAEWDDIYYNDLAPMVFDKIVNTIKMDYINTDMTSTTRYKGGERVIRINFNGTTSKRRMDFPITMQLYCNSPTVKALKDMVTLTIENVRIAYSTPHFNGLLFSGYAGDDLLDGTTLYIPESAEEKKDPHKEDKYLVQKLIEHLNSNLEHYNKSLWQNLDPDRRYMLLDGFNIQIYNEFGLPIGFRSLASVVKNQLLAIVGNSLVLPVAPGYKVGQDFVAVQTQEGVQQEISLLDHYRPLTPVPPYRVSIPTRGVFMEAVQGACDACEKVKENSSQDWTKFTTDEPSAIGAITPPVPTITDWKAAFKEFASPIVNIQNAPAAPEPGAGLAGLAELMGKAGIFKDVTGLDANQQNAIKTYLSNQENAKAFAEMAKSMAIQGHNTDNSSKIMDTLKTAKDSGALNQDDYSKLVKDHLQQQIDGGATKKAELEKEKAVQKPTLTDAAVKAADQGKDVKAQKTDTDGNTESVEITSGSTSTVLAAVQGIVPKLKQPSDNTCWAATATMMMSWKRQQSMSITSVMTEAGAVYLQKFNDNLPLLSNEKEAFITALGMVGEAPASYPLQQYIDWLKTYGPLWITTDSSTATGQFSPHARILTRIEGSGNANGTGTTFVFNDPATGTERSEPFSDFLAAYEQMVTDNSGDLFIQIVHFADATPQAPGEGAPSSSVSASGTDPGIRECCALGQWKVNALAPGALDPTQLGNHIKGGGFFLGGEIGYIYTKKAGLMDLGHIRDMADMVKFIFDALVSGVTKLDLFEGKVEVLTPPAATKSARLDFAAAIAFVESWAHELRTWKDYSSFSAEDVPSNMVGIEVGKRGVTAGGNFNTSVDFALNMILNTELSAATKAQTEQVLTKIENDWFKMTGVTLSPIELLRRNFDGKPWMAGMPFDNLSSVTYINTAIFEPLFTKFKYEMKFPVNGSPGVTLTTMKAKTAALRTEWVTENPGKDQP
ncbi:DUF4056 domain-containing protein [Chryseolinea soli]|uniref:DUF4056 domain-containing protein n=1 Tax=Chryseolinea soli TaxID=2321403 RepID=A0A385ST64_9BACT|nr:DUF4056 domain-containing protein [Chryseolinea soli]AYB33511.1 DUF4056 domain-containing protein [Chryseolinea soli]